ncbi:MAG: ribonuclease III [Ignavibacteria bacterium]
MFKWIRNFISNQKKVDRSIDWRLAQIEKLIGCEISNPDYFIKAITHRSYLEIDPELSKSNERLEFLGDAVLGLVTAETLFNKFKGKGEGFLTKVRSQIVKRESLAEISEKLNFKEIILYDTRFIKTYRNGLNSISSDAIEALIGAIYLDSGLENASKFILKHIINPVLMSGEYKVDTNFKGQLLELTHALNLDSPIYKIVEESGPGHDKIFTAEVKIGDIICEVGKGKNKKTAEQDAAGKALNKLQPSE